MTDAADNSPRPTTASLDARVARLELQVIEVAGEQKHMKEMLELRFDNLGKTVEAQGSEMRAFIARMDSMISQSLQQSGDVSATAAGRQVLKELNDLREKSAVNASKLQTLSDLAAQQRGAGQLFVRYILPTASLAFALVSLLIAGNVVR